MGSFFLTELTKNIYLLTKIYEMKMLISENFSNANID